ncbi:uncharacterized protein [Spinacia oleracea]|uniref:DUF674 domain-containing protein n=1 Tax=Spinacia oleracea TaxID=3562 RepID=A0A9R0JI66_SPIOL|nr:uncharacterized protein LOC110805659 [Spinacia oleracea]
MATKSKVSLKLLIDTKANRVLFAEANKEFVDFLFHIMSLPVGTIVKLLGVKGMVGGLGLLYESIGSLGNDYLQDNLDRDSVLNPKTAASVPFLSLNDAPPSDSKKYYYRCCSTNGVGRHCRNDYYAGYNHNLNKKECHDYVTDNPEATCPGCNSKMSTQVTYVAPESSSETVVWSSKTDGYVKGVVTYMVMDNLEVKPMSTISSITFLNKFNIIDIASVAEKEIQLNLHEGVAILKAALETQAVLTTIE